MKRCLILLLLTGCTTTTAAPVPTRAPAEVPHDTAPECGPDVPVDPGAIRDAVRGYRDAENED